MAKKPNKRSKRYAVGFQRDAVERMKNCEDIGKLAEELGVNVLYGGHYATETFGVKALAAHLSRTFKVPWVFLDHPSGL